MEDNGNDIEQEQWQQQLFSLTGAKKAIGILEQKSKFPALVHGKIDEAIVDFAVRNLMY